MDAEEGWMKEWNAKMNKEKTKRKGKKGKAKKK